MPIACQQDTDRRRGERRGRGDAQGERDTGFAEICSTVCNTSRRTSRSSRLAALVRSWPPTAGATPSKESMLLAGQTSIAPVAKLFDARVSEQVSEKKVPSSCTTVPARPWSEASSSRAPSIVGPRPATHDGTVRNKSTLQSNDGLFSATRMSRCRVSWLSESYWAEGGKWSHNVPREGSCPGSNSSASRLRTRPQVSSIPAPPHDSPLRASFRRVSRLMRKTAAVTANPADHEVLQKDHDCAEQTCCESSAGSWASDRPVMPPNSFAGRVYTRKRFPSDDYTEGLSRRDSSPSKLTTQRSSSRTACLSVPCSTTSTATVVVGGLCLKLTASKSKRTVVAKSCPYENIDTASPRPPEKSGEHEQPRLVKVSSGIGRLGFAGCNKGAVDNAEVDATSKPNASAMLESILGGGLPGGGGGGHGRSVSGGCGEESPMQNNNALNSSPQTMVHGAGMVGSSNGADVGQHTPKTPPLDSVTEQRHTEHPPQKSQDEIWSDVFRKVSEDHKLRREDVPRALELLGIMNPTQKWIDEVFNSLTKQDRLGEMEFIQLVALYSEYQAMACKKAFEQYDSDGSGYVDAEELAALLHDLGVEPMHHVLMEVIHEVDEDGQGSLDLHEFMKVMDIVRVRECFTRKEYDNFMRVFNRFDVNSSGDMDTIELMNLLNWLSYPIDETEAEMIVREVDVDGSGTINDREFLICMRKVREMEVELVKSAIAICDTDGTGTISGSELHSMLCGLGYLPDEDAVKDAMLEAGVDVNSKELDLSEVFRVVCVFRHREGLTAELLTDIEAAFTFFDKECTGELSTLDVGKMLSWLGYPMPFEQQQHYVSRVDVDLSGKLNLAEFRKMIRMHHEDHVEILKTAFNQLNAQTSSRGLLTLHAVELLFKSLDLPGGLKPDFKILPEDTTIINGEKRMGLHSFVKCVSRAMRVSRKAFRENGGFTKSEVAELRRQFQRFDQDESGDISNRELIKVIESIFPKVANDPTMRPKLVTLLNEVDQNGDGSLDFQDFLRLMRQFRDLEDRECAAKEQQAILDTGFSKQEVLEFRELFRTMAQTQSGVIVLDELMEIIGSICPLGDKNVTEFLKIFQSITGPGRMEADFAEFILLMRKLLILNFAGIQQRTESMVKQEIFLARRHCMWDVSD
eukprot:TRINITY_DN34802_c0_g1_i1.p1 TRINITY_DN34802_c0_g1~~TRINITY_DN34802_c0_g1_i1.p1  ORF type:complete len:1142 (+),score=178.73 TRINITY_DN34802_c0_g1_i1:140-3565(+)